MVMQDPRDSAEVERELLRPMIAAYVSSMLGAELTAVPAHSRGGLCDDCLEDVFDRRDDTLHLRRWRLGRFALCWRHTLQRVRAATRLRECA